MAIQQFGRAITSHSTVAVVGTVTGWTHPQWKIPVKQLSMKVHIGPLHIYVSWVCCCNMTLMHVYYLIWQKYPIWLFSRSITVREAKSCQELVSAKGQPHLNLRMWKAPVHGAGCVASIQSSLRTRCSRHTHTHTQTHTSVDTWNDCSHWSSFGLHGSWLFNEESNTYNMSVQTSGHKSRADSANSHKMTTAILDDTFLICGQVSGSFRTLEVSVGISLAIARQVLEHQKLSCNLSRGPCNNLNPWHGSGRCIAAVQIRHVSLLKRVKEQLDHTRLAGLHWCRKGWLPPLHPANQLAE